MRLDVEMGATKGCEEEETGGRAELAPSGSC